MNNQYNYNQEPKFQSASNNLQNDSDGEGFGCDYLSKKDDHPQFVISKINIDFWTFQLINYQSTMYEKNLIFLFSVTINYTIKIIIFIVISSYYKNDQINAF